MCPSHGRPIMPRRRIAKSCALGVLALGAAASRPANALPPRYDHVVVVVLENINSNEIIGSASAPYLNALATEGGYLTNAYSLLHTSAPEYGELFAGSDNGIVDGAISPNIPYTTPNLGAELRQNGYSFAGYFQSMPSVGYTGLTSGQYSRGHNPVVNWQNDAAGADPNQLPSSTNLPFTNFPTTAAGFANLPTVSLVVPDNDHNMHNGSTLAQRLSNGDNFLKTSVDAYYQWAKTHNSLLIVTADEDDRGVSGNYNNIPAIFAGANVNRGSVASPSYTLHNLLRTVEDMYALPHAANAGDVRPIAGVFAGDAPVNLKTFQNGANGYTGAHDTLIRADNPAASFGATTPLVVNVNNGTQPLQSLVRFDNLIGAGTTQIPADATVLSAKLKLWTTTTTLQNVKLHRMLASWNESSTWNSFGSGIAANDVEAVSTPDFSFAPKVANEGFYFDVSDSVQAWLDGAANNGWALLPTSSDDYQFNSSEFATIAQRPQLEVAYALYPRFIGPAGSWNTPANWANGTPNGAAAVARFLTRGAATGVTLDGDKTVGSLIFDGPGAYTLNPGVGGKLTLANYGNIASITLKSGQHAVNVPLNLVDPTSIDVASGGQLNLLAGATLAAGRTLTKTGAGTLDVSGADLVLNDGASIDVTRGEARVASIAGSGTADIRAGATLTLTGGPTVASRLTALTLAGVADGWNGKLDIGTSGLILEYSGASPLPTVANQIKAAQAAGWTGNGIGSSAAAATPDSAVVVFESAALLKLSPGQTGTFMNQSVDATALLIRYVLRGDADLDGTVGFHDLVCLAQNYDTAPGMTPDAWMRGDFDGDGLINFTDLTLLARNYGDAIPSSPASLVGFVTAPEPCGLAVISLLLTLTRRRGASHRSII